MTAPDPRADGIRLAGLRYAEARGWLNGNADDPELHEQALDIAYVARKRRIRLKPAGCRATRTRPDPVSAAGEPGDRPWRPVDGW